MDKEIREDLKKIKRGTAEIISEEELIAKLKKAKKKKRPLKVKLGIDASASNIHLGTAVPLYKLKDFQELGHEVIFLIGDFTGMIGDPSGQSKTRKPLTHEEVEKNAASLKKQIFKILDKSKTKVVFNSDWCKKMSFEEVIKLSANYTVAQMLERDDFEKRYKANQPIGLHEFLYPLIQGYDSVVLEADIEICGTDQMFNCLVGRSMQEAFGQDREVIIMLPILEGLGTKEKMSKSLGNYIGITESAEDMFAKIMRITDEQIDNYLRLCTRLGDEEVKALKKEYQDRPKELKQRLGIEVVKLYHSEKKAEDARETFELKHGKKGREIREDFSASKDKLRSIAQTVKIKESDLKDGKIWLPKLITMSDAAKSNSEARRLIQQQAVKVDGEVVTDIDSELSPKKDGYILEVGSRKVYDVRF